MPRVRLPPPAASVRHDTFRHIAKLP
jgi:hypothetical protein